MSEKLDGVRAIWDGETLKSRNGKTFQAPEWFTAGLPRDAILDGELWEDRGQFQKTVGKVRAHAGDWSNIKFMIFDTITDRPFAERLQSIQGMRLPAHCVIVEHLICKSRTHLGEYESSILAKGGEGVMLRKAESSYQHKRSKDLLKVKRFVTDEAVVTGYTEGSGRHAGRVGALICEWMDKTFQIGTGLSDALRENAPALGSVITFSYFEMTDGGIPRFPSFVATRDYE